MKKTLLLIFVLIISFLVIFNINNKNKEKDLEINNEEISEESKEEQIDNNFVSGNGWLKIENNRLVNEHGKTIQLKGMSTHGIQWYKEFANEEMMKKLKEEWNSNLFRIAMYTNEQGYIQDKSLEEDVIKIVDLAIKLDMYVIIDWHILSDNNPNIYIEEAKEFFNKMSNKYKEYPNVIYEICNEPNGNVTWDDDIKPYAGEVIKVIRKNSKKSIIIVGTPTWSQDVDKASYNPIDDEYVMYALHFYAGTNTDYLIDKLKSVVNNIPIFISEWGLSDASGSGGVYIEEGNKWMTLIDEYNLSWANWSLSNKDESSALLIPNAPNNSLDDKYLSESGKFVKEAMKNKTE